jgi:hypothetical protein
MKLSIVDDDDQALPTAETLTKEMGSGSEKRRVSEDEKSVLRSDTAVVDTTSNSEDTDPLYNQTELAKLFNISRNTVIDILTEHGVEPVVPGQGGPRGKRYRLSEVQDILKTKYIKSDRKTAATERKLEAEAELKEIEVQKKRGELIAVSDVELGAVQLFRALHTRMVQYCDDSALDISRLRTRGEVAAHQKDAIGKILQDLRSNPNNFISRYAGEAD